MCGLAGGRRERLWVGVVREDILAVVGLELFLKDVWYLDGELEGWAPRLGRKIGKDDVAGVTEVGMCGAHQRMVRRPAWQEQRSPLGRGGH